MSEPLKTGEELLVDPAECWFRHVFPSAITDRGEVGAIAFRCPPEHGGKLSGARSAKTTAQKAFEARVATKPNTVGTWGVTVAEAAQIRLRCIDDSQVETEPKPPADHAYVDLRGLGKVREREVRQELADFANDRGQLAPQSELALQWPSSARWTAFPHTQQRNI